MSKLFFKFQITPIKGYTTILNQKSKIPKVKLSFDTTDEFRDSFCAPEIFSGAKKVYAWGGTK
jgi:hypothetical protein